MAETLEELAVRAGAGDVEAFRSLVEQVGGPLHALASHILGGHGEAEDAVQETLTRALSALPRFQPRGDGACLAWLRRIAVNVCRDVLRARRTRPAPADTATLEVITGGADGEVRAAGIEDVAGDRQMVREAVRRLPPMYREVVALRYGQDLSYEDIARTLGVGQRTVATRLRRALARLQVELGEDGMDR